MSEDIRLAKGEDMDALKETVNAHIGDDYIHVTAMDKEKLERQSGFVTFGYGRLFKEKARRSIAVAVSRI